jgi:hypothetical protein
MADDDTWVIARTEEQGSRVLFRYRAIAPARTTPVDYPDLINIYWRFDGSGSGGMPSSAMADRMVSLEKLLDTIEDPAVGFLMVAITGNNRKEWIWYVSNRDTFVTKLNGLLGGLEPFPIELEAGSDPNWDNYRHLLASVDERPH